MNIIERLNMFATAVGGDIKNLNTIIGNKNKLITREKENLVESINSLVNDVETVKTETSNNIEAIKTRLNSAEENIQNLNQSISKIDENKNNIAKNLEEIKKNKESINSNLAEIEKNKEFITGAKTDILSNLEKIKNNNNNIESLKNTDKTHEASINSINKTVADLAAKTIDLQNKVGNINVSSALATKLDTTTERHIKEGTYQLQNDGTITLTKIDGAGAEKPNEAVKITGVATKVSVDTLTTKVGTVEGVANQAKATAEAVNTALANKADKTALETLTIEVNKKANTSDVNAELAKKVNTSDIQNLTTNKLDVATERHIKQGTYTVGENGSVTLTKVDGQGIEKTDEAVIINDLATKTSIDNLTTEVAKKANINDVNSRIEEGKTALREEINSAKEAAITKSVAQSNLNIAAEIEKFKTSINTNNNPNSEKIKELENKIEVNKTKINSNEETINTLKATLGDKNQLTTENKNNLVEAINSTIEKAKKYEEGVNNFKELIGINPEIAKVNEISINPFELLAKFIKNSLSEKTQDDPENETIYCLFNNEKNIKNFIKDEQLDNIKKGIKFIQGNTNKYIPFNSLKNNDLTLPQELNLNEEFKLEIHDVFGYYEKTYKFLPYLEYIKKDRDFNQLNNYIVYTNYYDGNNQDNNEYYSNDNTIIILKIEKERDFTEEELKNIYSDRIIFYNKDYYKKNYDKNTNIIINKEYTKYFNPQTNTWNLISDLFNFNLIEKNKERLLNYLNNNFDEYIRRIYKVSKKYAHSSVREKTYYSSIEETTPKSILIINEMDDDFINKVKEIPTHLNYNTNIIFNSNLTKILNRVNFEWIQLSEEKINQIKNKLIDFEITYLKNNFYNFYQQIKNSLDLTKKDSEYLFLINENSEELNQLKKEELYEYYDTKERCLIFNKDFTKIFLRIISEWVTLNQENKQRINNLFKENYLNAFNNLKRVFITNDLSTNPNWSENPKYDETVLYIVDKNNFTIDNSLDLTEFYNLKRIIADKNSEFYYNIITREWIRPEFNIKEKINNAYLKLYN